MKKIEPVARFIETCVGGKIIVNGVEIPSFPIGTAYDEAKMKIVDRINSVSESINEPVAWILFDQNGDVDWDYVLQPNNILSEYDEKRGGVLKPVFTEPNVNQIKQLQLAAIQATLTRASKQAGLGQSHATSIASIDPYEILKSLGK